MKYILIVGGSKSAHPFLCAAKNKGYGVIVVDQNQDCYCFDYCDLFIALSTFDYESVYDEIRKKKLEDYIKGVLSYSSYPKALMTVSFISSKLNLPGFSSSSVKATYDKAAINRIFYEHKVKAPKVYNAEMDINQLLLSHEHVQYPFVIKQINGIGSRGTRIIHNKNELIRYVSDFKSSSEKYVTEEYVEGDLYHVDGYVQNGRSCVFNAVKKLNYHLNGIPLTSGYIPFSDIIESSKYIELIEQVNRGVTSLGINNNYFGADIIINEKTGEFYILEIGYLLDAKMDRLLSHSGIDIYEMLIDIISGVDIDVSKLLSIKIEKCLDIIYAKKGGKLLINPDYFNTLEWEREDGDKVNIPNSISDLIGWYIHDFSERSKIALDKIFKIY
jgi:biotin carboxylase